MSDNKQVYDTPLEELTLYLEARLETIFANWRLMCEADPAMNDKSGFSREEFNDQMPVMMGILLARFRREDVDLEPVAVASEHGLHRWQSGYLLPELLKEIEHLFSVVVSELQTFQENTGRLDVESLLFAQQQIFRIYGESNRGSVIYYHQLMQNVAAERAQGLEFALGQLHQLGQQRGEHLRESSHDLRSSFSILMVASQMLESPRTEQERTELMQMLNRNLSSIREMLLQLTDYARIEAGHEDLQLQTFNVASLVKEIIDSAMPLAKHHGLVLEGNGPELEINSDRVKVQRILINLLYNALKYTRSGGIYISWGMENAARWTLSIQDTGPGFTPNSPAALLAEQLKPSIHTAASHQKPELLQEPPLAKSEATEQTKESEGLGLFIVKKLCELLQASMDIESAPGKGTLVRIRFMVKQEQSKDL